MDVSFGSLVPAFVLAGIGMGLTFAPMSTVALGSVDAGSQGVASGTLNMVREFGVAVGVAALASVFASQGSYANPSVVRGRPGPRGPGRRRGGRRGGAVGAAASGSPRSLFDAT